MADNNSGTDPRTPCSPGGRIPNGRARPSKRQKIDAKQAEAIWQRILRAAESTLAALAAADDSGDEQEDLPHRLLVEAWAALTTWTNHVRAAELTKDSAGWWRNDLVTIQSYIEGAAALAAGTPRGVILDGVKSTVKNMIADLRRDDFPDRGAYYPQLFMSGVRKFADALEEIYSADDDSASFEATDRGPGVSQNRKAIERLMRDFRYNPGALEGFTAALTGFLAPTRHSSWGDAVGYFRGVTYAEYRGRDDNGGRACSAQPTAAAAPPREEEISAFMEGKATAATMLAATEQLRGDGRDEADLRATYRGRGVAQNVVAKAFLQQVMKRPELLDGFAAALTGILMGENESDLLRGATYEDCVGGPGTKYIEEEDVAQVEQEHRPRLAVNFTPERRETVSQAGAFLYRMVDHFRNSSARPVSRDWTAMHTAASVVMSGVNDTQEDDDRLAERLDAAIDAASVMFDEQLSTHFRMGGGIREQDLERVFITA